MPQSVTALRPFLLRRAHLRVLVAAVELAQDRLGEVPVLAAASRFFGRRFRAEQALETYLSDRDAHSQFFPWLLWDAELPGGPLGSRLRKTYDAGAEREVLEALLAARPDVFQVVGLGAKSTVLERVADGRCHAVSEPVLQAVAAQGELFVARVLECGDCCLLDAVHASLPGAARRALVRAARRKVEAKAEMRLPQLLSASRRAVERIAMPELPWQGSGALLRATHVFDVSDKRKLVATLKGAVQSGELQAQSASRFVVADEQFGPVGAVLRISGERLYAATSSSLKTHALRRALEGTLGSLTYSCTLYRDLDALLDPRLRDRWAAGELRSIAQDWVDECIATFRDTPHDWLGGVTPREAVRTPAGRLQVRAWLRAVERVSEVAGPGYRSALQSIWRELAGT